jgi:small-conductance mechanosensitive channel
MSIFKEFLFGNTVETWLIALGIAILCFIVLKIIQKLLCNKFISIAKRTENKIDDVLAEVVKRTRFFFLAIVAIYIGSRWITLPATIMSVWSKVVIVVTLLQVALWANGVLSFVLTSSVKNRIETDPSAATGMSALNFVGKILIWSFILLLILDNLGVNITTLIAGLGVGGIAAALALQNVLSDLFASISIILDKPFVYGDFIVVDKMMGTVEHIGLKTTRVRSISGEQIVFSNTDLLASRVSNFKRMEERRSLFTITVSYETSLNKLNRITGIIKEIIDNQKHVRFDRAHFKEYSPSALIFEVVYYIDNPDFNLYMDVQHEINMEIFSRFGAEKIEFGYPVTTVHLKK